MDTTRIALVDDPAAHAALRRVASRLGLRPDAADLVPVLGPSEADPLHELHELVARVTAGTVNAALLPALTLPLILPAGVIVGAVFRLSHYGFRLIAGRRKPARSLRDLGPGTRLLTTEALARAQLRCRFPNLVVGMERHAAAGAIDKGPAGWDVACVPAEELGAGVEPEKSAVVIPVDDLLPPVGQGSVVILIAEHPTSAADRLRAAGDAAEIASLAVERIFLRAVSEIPDSVATARAILSRDRLELTGLVAGVDGGWLVEDAAAAGAAHAPAIAMDLADACRDLARQERAGVVSMSELVGSCS